MHKKSLIPLLFFLCTLLPLRGQEEGLPYSFTHTVSPIVPTEVMPAVDMEAARTMEAEADKRGEYTFGVEIPVQLNTLNSGLWENLPDGGRLWRLGLRSDSACSINLQFGRFHLPAGATLHIYTADQSHISGAYTSANHLPGGGFATPLLPGGQIVLEYREPPATDDEAIIMISTVVHGYKDFFFQKGKYGNSGRCNIDIRCKEGDGHRQAQRAVCMILNGSKILCSGTLVNNTARDRTPYLLTAYHCLNTAQAYNMVFIFQHEADNCQSSTYQEGFSITGATVVAKNYDSDFALLKLSRTPPTYFHTYYAGWNCNDTAASSAVSIHHPSGDVKKISVCNQKLAESDNNGESFGNTHWKVPFWSKGTTEGGSSGCGLFNAQQQVIGQLDGGTASCLYQEGYDVFGKLAYSWESGNIPNAGQRLKDWLDPLQTGATMLNGLDPDSSDYETDVQLLELLQPDVEECRMTLKPSVCWSNNGNLPVTDIQIHYMLDSLPPRSITRQGNWKYGSLDTVVIDTLHGLAEGMHSLLVWVSFQGDANSANDTLRSNFAYHRGASASWEVRTDYYPSQTHWILKTASGDTIAKNPEPLNFSTTYRDTFCLQEGCSDFIITDSAGDGLTGRDGGWQGSFHFFLQGRCIRSGIDFGYRDSIRFCVDSTVSVRHIPFGAQGGRLTIFPNPCQEQLRLRIAPLQESSHRYEIYSMEGRKLMEGEFSGSETVIDVQSLHKGPYLLRAYGSKGQFNKLFVKE